VNRSRPSWRTVIGLVAGLSAFAATAALALTGHTPASGPTGSEGVPIPAAASLALPRRLRVGEQIDGITCQTGEQVAYHVHAHLAIVVRGHSRRIPAGVGIATPYEVAPTRAGPFVAAGSCFMWLHTHAADGVIHVESPTKRTYTLGEFFDIWGQPLSRSRVGAAHGLLTAIVNGGVFTGNPRQIPLLAHSQIELELGFPLVSPEKIEFPHGL